MGVFCRNGASVMSQKYIAMNVISNGVRNLTPAGSYKISPFGRDDNLLLGHDTSHDATGHPR